MYSAQKSPKIRTPEQNNVASSPLRALTPLVDVIKSAQTKATKDFESFYGNLMSRLTPKTSNARIRKRMPETTQRTKSLVNQKRLEVEHNRTSLTPLFERHTLREEYTSHNPFYEDSVSETTDDVLEFDMIDDDNTDTSNSNNTIDGKGKNTNTASLLDKLKDETIRMERLESNLSIIKKQSSFLAQCNKNSNSNDDKMATTQKNKKNIDNANTNYITPAIQNTYLTPPQSNDWYSYRTQTHTPSQLINSKDKPVIDKANEGLLEEIPYAKLKSAEIVRTPGGTRICNRFWKEIHGLNAKREYNLSPMNTGRIEKKPLVTKQLSTLNNKKLWDDNDDTFWTTESSTARNSSSFNQRLLRMKQFEQEQGNKGERIVKQITLSEEIESANKRDEAEQQQKSLPTSNPRLLEELKKKYRDKLIDDSDSYKFS
ncbi:hypothetical protein G6F57_011106 [Rhizopus arrhizus]|uniref:Uncharacterized protein n=1 Tax=Rhizopus oryzae TaxID=64495 RepID=A0A9P6X0E4_RHIOR|nr:hypothetical protein G6F23_008118 [Rhizopus arrhizus]KAG0806448.1 hypothetical protein G6F20_011116 [Rhizopus arrhizus]KAG0848819.1 hypothetical protein G6F17_011315 [Rhizopus arrhizus]KAG0864252.1 hypothetical protein G6F16_011169 [Rhizopus arrhizus]KAG0891823.1 hypothetical protein G6F34_011375 [Rhizopus arrhizus]